MIGALKRGLVLVHRWLGVALSAILMLWFASGIVMMYRSYPSVRARDRLERLPALDPARVRLSAAEAFSVLASDPQPAHVLLTSFDGRPVYLGDGAMVYADDGSEHRDVDTAMIDRAAVAWSGRPLSEATKTSVEEPDQWTLSSDLRALRPLYKYSWPDGQQVYVDGSTADVVQFTTSAARLWAYLGAIPHWLYFTPLRLRQGPWYSLVVWPSLIATVAALLGLLIAAWMYSPRRRYRHTGRPTGIPYSGWKRWHTVAGLFFGVVATTWTFSGLLTMGPFPIMERFTALTVPSVSSASAPRREIDWSHVFRGGVLDFESYADKAPAAAIASVRDLAVKEVEYTSFAGEPVYLVSDGRGESRIVPVHGAPLTTFDIDDLMRRIREAAGDHLAELRLLEQYDAYYLDRRGTLPLPVIYARMNDVIGSRYYINPRTATLVGSYSAHQWVDRWLLRGLHSFDFPWLYNNRPLWDVVVITLMLGGTALCMTSLVLTWRILTRTLVRVWRVRIVVPNEDLAT